MFHYSAPLSTARPPNAAKLLQPKAKSVAPPPGSKEAVIADLMRVHDVGDKRALKLYDLGIRSLADLRRRQKEEQLQAILHPCYPVALNKTYAEEWQRRIPREEIRRIEWIVAHETAEVVAVRWLHRYLPRQLVSCDPVPRSHKQRELSQLYRALHRISPHLSAAASLLVRCRS